MCDAFSTIEPATALEELLVLLTLADHPVDEQDIDLCERTLKELRQADPHFARLLAPLSRLRFIEALGHLHAMDPLEVVRQKHARDLGKALTFLSPRHKACLRQTLEAFLDAQPSKGGMALYRVFLSRMA